jgi:hypothetical protein
MLEPGTYNIWIRSYKRRINDQQNFITVNGKAIDFAGDDNPLDQWNWESVGTFNLPAGTLTLGLGRVYGQDEMFSVFIDSLLITPDLENLPEESSVWQTIYAGEEVVSTLSKYMVGGSLSPGFYRWSVRVFDGDRLVDSLGVRGNPTPYTYFTILP